MDNYLTTKFKGKYRILAEFDLDTNDFIRDTYENLDSSFGDFYIPCVSGGKLTHATGSYLAYFTNTKPKALNLLRRIYKILENKEYPPKENDKYAIDLCQQLKKHSEIKDCEILDFEGYVVFKLDFLDKLEPIIKPKTKGADISPFSPKNLPAHKEKSQITAEELKRYKSICAKYTQPLTIKSLSIKFIKNNDIPVKRGMSSKETIFRQGSEMWNKYLEYLNQEVI